MFPMMDTFRSNETNLQHDTFVYRNLLNAYLELLTNMVTVLHAYSISWFPNIPSRQTMLGWDMKKKRSTFSSSVKNRIKQIFDVIPFNVFKWRRYEFYGGFVRISNATIDQLTKCHLFTTLSTMHSRNEAEYRW